MLAVVASFFIACDKDKDIEDSLEGSIVGSWIIAEIDGKPVLTNDKVVFNFVSATKAYMSAAKKAPQGYEGYLWNNRLEQEVIIDGNKILLIYHDTLKIKLSDSEKSIPYTSESEISVTSFNSNELKANIISRLIINDQTFTTEYSERLIRVNVDYRESIVGTWQGRCTSVGGSAYDDGKTHRWEYRSDSTYCYYYNENDEWKESVAVYSDYFVDGPLLCTKWQNEGEHGNIENWEIVSIKDNVMKWKGWRKNDEGEIYEVTFEMTKVSE